MSFLSLEPVFPPTYVLLREHVAHTNLNININVLHNFAWVWIMLWVMFVFQHTCERLPRETTWLDCVQETEMLKVHFDALQIFFQSVAFSK